MKKMKNYKISVCMNHLTYNQVKEISKNLNIDFEVNDGVIEYVIWDVEYGME